MDIKNTLWLILKKPENKSQLLMNDDPNSDRYDFRMNGEKFTKQGNLIFRDC